MGFISYHDRKQCITSESQFDFLKELVEKIPDLPANEEEADDDEPKPKRFDYFHAKESNILSTLLCKNLTTCSGSANKPSTSCFCTAYYKLSTNLKQAVSNL